MKTQRPSTFVLNRNDIEHYLVEGKVDKSKAPIYNVYYDKTDPVVFSADMFVEIHGLDEKKALHKFSHDAFLHLTSLQGLDPKINETCEKFNQINNKLSTNQDPKKPVIDGYRNTLVEAIIDYNDIRKSFDKKPEISYIEDYNYLKSSKENENERFVPLSVENAVKETIKMVEEPYDGKRQRTRIKYDN